MNQIGPRIRLRDWQKDDLKHVRIWHQPGQKWHEFDAPYLPKSTSVEIDRLEERLAQSIAEQNWPSPRWRAAIADKENDSLLGNVSWYWHSEETYWLNVGIVLYDPATWGQGLGTEALGLWCDYVFEAMPQIVRIGLMTWSGNHGMIHVAQKLGFREEARFRKARIVDGVYFDSLGYGVLREEWTALYPNSFTD